MINTRYSGDWKFLVRFIPSLALGALMVLPMVSMAESSGGTDDAKKQAATLKRDPFWPMGYVPKGVEKAIQIEQKAERAPARKDWSSAMKKISINGVSSRANNEFFAVVNGQVKSVGDKVTLEYEGTIYTWVVDSIKPPKSVKLRRVSAL